ncbi:MAG: hypothetical protein ACTSU2_16645 [Promethearchaeota archaeon]
MTKYYKSQSPVRSTIWFLIISLIIILPEMDYSLLESIIFLASGHGHDSNLDPLPFILVIFILLLVFKKKHPRTITILANTLMLVLFSLSIGNISSKFTYLLVNGLIKNFDIIQPTDISSGLVSIFLYFAAIRVINKTKMAFGDVEPEKDSVILTLWILIVLIHILAIILAVPAFMAPLPDVPNATGYEATLVYLVYVLLLVYIIKLGISAYKSIKEFQLTKRKKAWGFKEAFLIVVFFLSWMPLVGHFIDHGQNTRDHSIYNPTWAGTSEFKQTVEDMGYDVYSVQSSLSALLSLNRSFVLIILGPTQYYNPLSEIPFFMQMFKDPYFSMLISDDHGSTTSLMIDMFLSSSHGNNTVPLALFPNGILWDNDSYVKAPYFPIIQNFESHPTTQGVHKVILSKASCILGGDLFSSFGWHTIGRTSVQYSFMDVNQDGKYKYEDDNYPLPQALTNIIANFGLNFSHGIPLGGYPQVTFAYNEMSAGNRLFLTTDASMFNNELINQYDNKKFAQNIVNWLTRGNKSIAVVFDESHNLKRGTLELTSATVFGIFQGYVNWLSMNPFLSWIYPLWAYRSLRNWISPKKDKKKKKKKEEEKAKEKEEELKFRTSSFFSKKINWYKTNKEYNKALILLFGRLSRKINKMLGGLPFTTENIMNIIEETKGKYLDKDSKSRIQKLLEKMEQIKKNKVKIEDEEEFNNIFFEMEFVNEKI